MTFQPSPARHASFSTASSAHAPANKKNTQLGWLHWPTKTRHMSSKMLLVVVVVVVDQNNAPPLPTLLGLLLILRSLPPFKLQENSMSYTCHGLSIVTVCPVYVQPNFFWAIISKYIVVYIPCNIKTLYISTCLASPILSINSTSSAKVGAKPLAKFWTMTFFWSYSAFAAAMAA